MDKSDKIGQNWQKWVKWVKWVKWTQNGQLDKILNNLKSGSVKLDKIG